VIPRDERLLSLFLLGSFKVLLVTRQSSFFFDPYPGWQAFVMI